MTKEETQLSEVERQFPHLVELSPDAVFLHGLDGKFVYVNDAACAMLGFRRSELLTMFPWDFVVNDSRDDILALWQGMAPGVPMMVEGIFRRNDGTKLPAEVRLAQFEDAGRDWIAAFCRDISARRKAEDALRSQERSRMARDIHDTLAHGLTAIAVQLEAARHVITTRPEEVAVRVGNALQLGPHVLRVTNVKHPETNKNSGHRLSKCEQNHSPSASDVHQPDRNPPGLNGVGELGFQRLHLCAERGDQHCAKTATVGFRTDAAGTPTPAI